MADKPRPGTTPQIDYLARDYDSLLAAMKELIPFKLPEWQTFDSQADFGNVLLQLFAHMGDVLSYYQDRVARESFLGTATSRYSVIQHLRLIGYTLATASPAVARLTLSLPGSFNGIARIQRGNAFATKSQKHVPSVRFEYNGTSDLVVDCALVAPDPSTGRKVFPSLIPVEEGRLVQAEVLGASDGQPSQTFRLSHPRLVLRAIGAAAGMTPDLELTSRLGAVVTPWALQDSLAFSRSDRHDYSVEIDADDQCVVRFGDGAFGAIPASGSSILATYRYGGGQAGNVVAGAIGTIVDAPALALLGARVSNPAPATGGAERESIEQAVFHAPAVFRSQRRAVTAEDYRALALVFPGVGKVRAVPAGGNLVKLFVAPSGGGQVSDVLRSNLLAYFEDKRPVSTLIEIGNADYIRIYVTAEVSISAYYARAVVAAQAAQAVAALLDFANVDFARTIYLSKFYEALENIDGIEFVNVTEFRSERNAPGSVNAEGKLDHGPNEIPKAPDDLVLDSAYLNGAHFVITGGF